MFLPNAGIYLQVHTELQARRSIDIFIAMRTWNFARDFFLFFFKSDSVYTLIYTLSYNFWNIWFLYKPVSILLFLVLIPFISVLSWSVCFSFPWFVLGFRQFHFSDAQCLSQKVQDILERHYCSELWCRWKQTILVIPLKLLNILFYSGNGDKKVPSRSVCTYVKRHITERTEPWTKWAHV